MVQAGLDLQVGQARPVYDELDGMFGELRGICNVRSECSLVDFLIFFFHFITEV